MSSSRKSRNRLTTVDLFCGCGGLSLGLTKAGFDVVAAYDNWPLALATYKLNFHHDTHLFDLSNASKAAAHIKQYMPDVLAGGPPCQDFSIAGKRIESHRASLTVAFAKIVSLVSPYLVIMENVYNIEKSKTLSKAVRILSEAGYGITTKVIDASLTGVPQKRMRFFLIGEKGGADNSYADILDAGLASKPLTVRDFFGDKIEVSHYYAHPRSYQRRAVFSVDEPSSTIRRVNRPIPKNYKKHPADKVKISRRVRILTTEERSQIQTFPRNYSFFGSKSQQEHQIANAVPVKLAQYVAQQVLKMHRT